MKPDEGMWTGPKLAPFHWGGQGVSGRIANPTGLVVTWLIQTHFGMKCQLCRCTPLCNTLSNAVITVNKKTTTHNPLVIFNFIQFNSYFSLHWNLITAKIYQLEIQERVALQKTLTALTIGMVCFSARFWGFFVHIPHTHFATFCPATVYCAAHIISCQTIQSYSLFDEWLSSVWSRKILWLFDNFIYLHT